MASDTAQILMAHGMERGQALAVARLLAAGGNGWRGAIRRNRGILIFTGLAWLAFACWLILR